MGGSFYEKLRAFLAEEFAEHVMQLFQTENVAAETVDEISRGLFLRLRSDHILSPVCIESPIDSVAYGTTLPSAASKRV